MRRAIPTVVTQGRPRTRRVTGLALGLFVAVLSSGLVHAQIGGATGNAITNYTGIEVSTNGTLDPLPVNGDFKLTGLGGTVTSTYRMGFQLLDSGGVSVSGPEVFSTPFTHTFPARQVFTGSIPKTLFPAGLNTGGTYTLRTQLYKQTSPGVFATQGFASDHTYRFDVVDSAASNAVAVWLQNPTVSRSYAVATIVGRESFQVDVQGIIGRRDQIGSPVSTDNYQVNFDAQIRSETTLADVPLVNSRTTITVPLPNHDALGNPASLPLSNTLMLQPAGQLDSTDSYTVTVKVSYTGPDNIESTPDPNALSGQRLLHFNGTLLFGAVSATIGALSNEPVPLGTVPTVGENTIIDLAVDGAVLSAFPSYIVTGAGDLNVLLKIDGTAVVTTGSAFVGAPTPTDTGSINGVTYSRQNVILDPTGATASFLTVNFPAGLGVTYATTVRRLLGSYLAYNVPLDGNLQPTGGTVAFLPSTIDATHLYVVHDDLPVYFECDGMTWDPSAGTFRLSRSASRYVRAAELNLLDANRGTLTDPTAADRPSNEGYFRKLDGSPGASIVITADAQGRAVLTTAHVDLLPGNFTAHFPLGTNVAWAQTGAVVVQDGALDLTQSSLPGAADVAFHNWPGAPANPPAPIPSAFAGPDDTFTFTPAATTWTFTADGGLRAEGTTLPAPLRWGARADATFADVTGNFSVADAHLPGHVLRGALATTIDDNRPGELLLTGSGQPGDAGYVERPGDASYAIGAADYAGLNFRVGSDGAQTATSEIGDATLGPYALRGTSKYYARPAGVSGIHEAVTSSFAGLAGALTVHGFALSLSNFQLSFLDNHVHESLITGTVTVPGARPTLAGFAQPFDRLTLTDKGELGPITIPSPNNFLHNLTYWRAQFHPLAGNFQQKPADASKWALIFGAEVFLPGVVKEPLRGGLGFYPGGNLVAASEGFPGVSSRLKPPKTIGLHGTGSLLSASRPAFSAQPVSDIYFTDAGPGSPDLGFVAFAGTVSVPFFRDLKVHVLARATGGDTNVRSGWGVPGNDFFSNTKFDQENRGFPPGVLLADYEDPALPPTPLSPTPYNPHAKQNWLGVVNFDFPLRWDAALRRFVSTTPQEERFLVFKSQRVISQLVPSGADIRFGLQFEGLPRVNLAGLLTDEGELTNKLTGLIPHGAELVAAVHALDLLLSGQSDLLITNGVDAALDAFLNGLVDQLKVVAPSASAASAYLSVPVNGSNALQLQLKNIVGVAADANSVMRDISDGLRKIDDGLAAADVILAKDGMGKRGAFLLSTLSLCSALGGLDVGPGDPVFQQIDNLINVQLASTLDDLQRAVDDVHALVTDARRSVTAIQGLIQGALEAVNAVGGTLPNQVVGAMQDYFAKAYDPTGTYVVEMAVSGKLQADLKRAAHEVINQSTFVTDLQSTVRGLVEPLSDQYTDAFHQIHGVLNDVVRSALSELTNTVLEAVNENVANANKAIGGFSDAFRLTRINGTARVIGNVLDRAHVEAIATLNVGGPLTLRGSLDYQHYQASQPVPACAVGGIPDGAVVITTTLDGNASIAGCPPVHAHAMGQYTMSSTGDPLAVSGSLSLDSDVHLDIVNLKHAEFDFAFGQGDNYLYAQGAGSILIFDVDVSSFVGRTSDPAILKKVDPLIDPLLKGFGIDTSIDVPSGRYLKPITGFYFHALGGVSLNRILAIPDDVVKLQARGGQGNFAFLVPAAGGSFVTPGLRWDIGIGVGIFGVTVDTDLHTLTGLGLGPISLASTDGISDLAKSLFPAPIPFAFPGVITGRFTVKVPVLPATNFDFTATGTYLAPPLAPPPGGFLVKKLKF